MRFQSGLVEVRRRGRPVGVGRTVDVGVARREQRGAVPGVVGREPVVVRDRGLHLFGVSHRAGQSLGVALGQGVVKVIFDRLLRDRKTGTDGLVRVPLGPRFLRAVEGDSGAFVLHRRGIEAAHLQVFFEGAGRRRDVVQHLVLLLVPLVLHTEDLVETRQEFLHKLGARNCRHCSALPYTPVAF